MNHTLRRGGTQHPLAINRFNPETRCTTDEILQVLDVHWLVVTSGIDGEHAPALPASPGAVFGGEVKYHHIAGCGFQRDGRHFGSRNAPSVLRTADLLLQALGIPI